MAASASAVDQGGPGWSPPVAAEHGGAGEQMVACAVTFSATVAMATAAATETPGVTSQLRPSAAGTVSMVRVAPMTTPSGRLVAGSMNATAAVSSSPERTSCQEPFPAASATRSW
jgi:hypothetical protein